MGCWTPADLVGLLRSDLKWLPGWQSQVIVMNINKWYYHLTYLICLFVYGYACTLDGSYLYWGWISASLLFFWLKTSPNNFLFLIFHTCVNPRTLRKRKENCFKNPQALSYSAFNKLLRDVYYSISASNLCTVYSFFLFNKEISKQYSGYNQSPKYSP